MDRRSEIREFLMSSRARVTPGQAGLYVQGDVRRVPGLRREKVADLAGVSADYYTQLERGDADGASDTVLNAVARALRLDDAERLHLFDLARFHHPVVGMLDLVSGAAELRADPGLTLLPATANPRSATEAALTALTVARTTTPGDR